MRHQDFELLDLRQLEKKGLGDSESPKVIVSGKFVAVDEGELMLDTGYGIEMRNLLAQVILVKNMSKNQEGFNIKGKCEVKDYRERGKSYSLDVYFVNLASSATLRPATLRMETKQGYEIILIRYETIVKEYLNPKEKEEVKNGRGNA